jgi:radical SAM protein with 4Fe4S-binding SPASM domain
MVLMRTGPDYIQLYPLLRCNRSCSFCFNQTMPFMEDMQLIDFRAMLDRISKWPVTTIDLMGGEPTLHHDMPGLLHEAARHGLLVNMSSNGTNIPQLQDLHARYTHLSIGMSINDRATFTAVRKFLQAHRPIAKMVHTRSLDAHLVREVLSQRPKAFYLLYKDALEGSQLLDTVPFDEFYPAAPDQFHGRGVGTVFCSGFLPDLATYPDLAGVRCPAGTTKLGIMPDGSVYPCNLFFGKPSFRLGNILTDPLDALWRHPVLAFFRAFQGNRCPRRTCDLHAACHGGCPAHAYHHTGDLSAPEPRCVRT